MNSLYGICLKKIVSDLDLDKKNKLNGFKKDLNILILSDFFQEVIFDELLRWSFSIFATMFGLGLPRLTFPCLLCLSHLRLAPIKVARWAQGSQGNMFHKIKKVSNNNNIRTWWLAWCSVYTSTSFRERSLVFFI